MQFSILPPVAGPASARCAPWLPAAVAAALWVCGPAQATTTYTIDTTITSATPTGNPLQTDAVVGTLTTDGTLGTLSAGDIVGWRLDLIDHLDAASDITLTNLDSLLVEDGGGSLSATSTGLFFDFSHAGEFLIQIHPYSGSNYFCFSTGGACAAGVTISPGYVYTDGVTLTGSAAPVGSLPLDPTPPSAVPEPSTCALMALGLAAMGAARKRRAATSA